MDMEGKPSKRPYKPYIPRLRGGRGQFRPRGGILVVTIVKGGSSPRVDSKEEEVESPVEENSLGESLIRAPLLRGLECLAKW